MYNSNTHISPEALEKYLEAFRHQEPRRPEDETPFAQLLDWMEKKQQLRTMVTRECEPGEIVVKEGEAGNVFYVIRSGDVVVVKGALDSAALLGFRWKGDSIGEMALIENLPRSATVIALTPVSLFSLDRELFYAFLSENPGISLSLMSMLSWRVRQSGEERLKGEVQKQQQNEAIETLSRQAAVDPLTGLFNRRAMDEMLAKELSSAQRNGTSVGILVADVDHFKKVNDTYGHKAGDLILQEVAKLLQHNVRASDYVCRFGGEEFVIIMPGASIAALLRCGEDVRSSFEALTVEYENQVIRATISLGAASFPEHGASGNEIIVRADEALYRAKHEGRNRVVVYSADPPGAA